MIHVIKEAFDISINYPSVSFTMEVLAEFKGGLISVELSAALQRRFQIISIPLTEHTSCKDVIKRSCNQGGCYDSIEITDDRGSSTRGNE